MTSAQFSFSLSAEGMAEKPVIKHKNSAYEILHNNVGSYDTCSNLYFDGVEKNKESRKRNFSEHGRLKEERLEMDSVGAELAQKTFQILR